MKINSLSKQRIKKIVNCFAAELTAIDTANKLKIHRNTVNKYYRIIREMIAQHEEENFRNYYADSDMDFFRLCWNKNTGLNLNPDDDTCNYFMMVYQGKIHIAPEEVVIENALNPESLDNEDARSAQFFYNYAKTKLIKFYGIRPQYAYLYLKELEFRFNNQDKNVSSLIWKVVSQPSSKRKRSESFDMNEDE
jgi:transposase